MIQAMRHFWLPPENTVLGVSLITLRNMRNLAELLPTYRLLPLELRFREVDAVIGWGQKLPARSARRFARALSLPFLTAEDGFLRSAGLGKQGAAAVSVTLDDLGVYYDARTPSRLEELIASGSDDGSRRRASDLRDLIIRERLTKYNHLPDVPPSPALGGASRRRILLVEQVARDFSISGACAGIASFGAMLTDALRLPNADIIIRSHPDVVAGLARGSFAKFEVPGHVRLIADAISPHAILDVVDEVWTVSSQLGFDALIRGLPVRCYGVPFYAGWGLTEDCAASAEARAALDRRRRAATRQLDCIDLVDAALLQFPLYNDPISQQHVEPERSVERLLLWRRHALQWRGKTFCPKVARHKHKVLRRFCSAPDAALVFGRRPSQTDRILVWGTRNEPVLPDGRTATPELVRVEDSFLRSVGLGVPGNQPISLNFDRRGIYYDATRESDLEHLLENGDFSQALLNRAAALRRSILAAGLTKYNLGGTVPVQLAHAAEGRQCVLVMAQVPDDQSLRLGLPSQPSNIELLRAVRDALPEAYIIFKEHPDLVSGRRPGLTDATLVARLANHHTIEGDAASWIAFADEVHIRTSLGGFEALMREKPVICHGAPFFSGWGLTRDMVSTGRRTRRRTLDELVAAALIVYPTYVHPLRGIPMEAEDAVLWLTQARDRKGQAS